MLNWKVWNITLFKDMFCYLQILQKWTEKGTQIGIKECFHSVGLNSFNPMHIFYYWWQSWDRLCFHGLFVVILAPVIKEKMRRDGRRGCVSCPLRNKLPDTPALVITLIWESHNIQLWGGKNHEKRMGCKSFLHGVWGHLWMAPKDLAWLRPFG